MIKVPFVLRHCWSTALSPGSNLRSYLDGQKFIPVVSMLITVPIAFITYVTVCSYDWPDLLTILAIVLLTEAVHSVVLPFMVENLSEHYLDIAKMRLFVWISVVSVVLGLATSRAVKDFSNDYSKMTASESALIVKEEVYHEVRPIRHCLRALKYFDVMQLRVRDQVNIDNWPYGWLIYFFLLIPNAIPALGIVAIFSGTRCVTNIIIEEVNKV
jgi:hypothetical protein